jgi:hypothetical protein
MLFYDSQAALAHGKLVKANGIEGSRNAVLAGGYESSAERAII